MNRLALFFMVVMLAACVDSDPVHPVVDDHGANLSIWELVRHLDSEEHGDSLIWVGLFQPSAPNYSDRALVDFLTPSGQLLQVEYFADTLGWRQVAPTEHHMIPNTSVNVVGAAGAPPSPKVRLGTVSSFAGTGFSGLRLSSRDIDFDWPTESGLRIVWVTFSGNGADLAEWLDHNEDASGNVKIWGDGGNTLWNVRFVEWRACREVSSGDEDCSKEMGWDGRRSFKISWGTGPGYNIGAERVYLSYNVTVDTQPVPPPPVAVTPIIGPSLIEDQGTYYWTVTAAGKNSPFTFNWQVRRSGPWTTVYSHQGQSASQYSAKITGPDEFDLRVVAESGVNSAESPILHVESTTLGHPTISGPNYVSSSDFYTYHAQVSGGTSPYTYQWRVFWGGPGHLGYGEWWTLGTDPSQTIYLDQVAGDVTVEVTVTSGDQVRTAYRAVTNGIGCPPGQMEC